MFRCADLVWSILRAVQWTRVCSILCHSVSPSSYIVFCSLSHLCYKLLLISSCSFQRQHEIQVFLHIWRLLSYFPLISSLSDFFIGRAYHSACYPGSFFTFFTLSKFSETFVMYAAQSWSLNFSSGFPTINYTGIIMTDVLHMLYMEDV